MKSMNYNSIFQSFCFRNVTRDKWDNKNVTIREGRN